MFRSLSIRYLILIANAFVLAIPVAAVVFFRLWDTHLVRVTEERLISEAILIAEVWREELLRDQGREPDVPERGGLEHPPHIPSEATLDLNYPVLPPAPQPQRRGADDDSPQRQAALKVMTLVTRAKHLTFSDVRILDAQGCVVASSGAEMGLCLSDLAEVREALAGRYAAVVRERLDHEPGPRKASPGRTARVRVFNALPIEIDDRVVGVVRMSRTSVSPLEALFKLKWTVVLSILGYMALMTAVSLFFSRVISRPVREITAAAEAIARGEPAHPFGTGPIRPVEIEALGGALDRMTRQLTDRANYISTFAANVSHELKTPITGIRGAVELLRDDWEGMSDEQRTRFLANIDADAARMERLVTRLLQLARIQSSPEAAATVEVEPFFRDLVDRYGDRVRLSVNGAPVSVTINPDHLETAVHNLVDNALRHGGDAPVEVNVGGKDGHVVIRVQDHGPGISEGNRTRIFERFFTTERDRGGTGLGLAIVQAVAETRGGSVTFDSGQHGTTFVLTV